MGIRVGEVLRSTYDVHDLDLYAEIFFGTAHAGHDLAQAVDISPAVHELIRILLDLSPALSVLLQGELKLMSMQLDLFQVLHNGQHLQDLLLLYDDQDYLDVEQFVFVDSQDLGETLLALTSVVEMLHGSDQSIQGRYHCRNSGEDFNPSRLLKAWSAYSVPV